MLARLLEPTYDVLGDYVADSELIHADEIPWPDFRFIEDTTERKRVLETIRARRGKQSRPLVEQLKTWMSEQRCFTYEQARTRNS